MRGIFFSLCLLKFQLGILYYGDSNVVDGLDPL